MFFPIRKDVSKIRKFYGRKFEERHNVIKKIGHRE